MPLETQVQSHKHSTSTLLLLENTHSISSCSRDLIKHPFFMPKSGPESAGDESDPDGNPLLAVFNLVAVVFGLGSLIAAAVISVIYFKDYMGGY